MKYTVEFSRNALKQMRKLDKPTRTRIYDWILEHLEGCENPRKYGKSLTANLAGEWRYRVGDYRVIAEIHDDKILVFITRVGHRREIYDD
ncbi:MAG: type II toxin-antitoxin system RelE/ParE family toxin [Synergistaceae bacterium]|nr:type II toxin-antitoxin system RelE/ParE family toxin [Synergistaceae bacterium]MBQ9595927.1 type II toxin-antitoxin system RelE/ParE family toxin [Synergistaceae bacterium]MBR0204519.1 type II toxin-antitoxin system RelE/ParE family toxin [Synergistaceae bacterium]